MNDIEYALKRPFTEKQVSWRIGQVAKDGSKASALAYIDARDVMHRLDEVVGQDNWRDEYREVLGRLVCRLHIRINDEWVYKEDGAGDTNMEGEKGGLSDAFKRAAVKWGVGRYLYALPIKWCDIDEYKKFKTVPNLPVWATPEGFDKAMLARQRSAGDTETGKSIKKSVLHSFSEDKQQFLRDLADDLKAVLGKPEEAWEIWINEVTLHDFGADEEVALRELFSKEEWNAFLSGKERQAA